MSRLTRRALLLPAAACAVIAVTATGAVGAGERAPARTTTVTERVEVSPAAVTIADDLRVPWPPRVTVTTPPGDVIKVRGTRCPKDHPRRVGTSSSASWTQVDGGPLRRHASRRLLCAR